MSHTPGPWKWWTSCSWRRLYARTEKGHDWPVLMPTNHPKDDHPDIIVTDADMALIAAAPDLLEALKTIVSLDNDAHPGLSTWHDFRVKANNDAKTAIAKAEGKP